MLARVAGPRFGDYQAGFRFGQLGYELVERRGLKRFEASTYHMFAIFVVRWTKHVRARRDLLGRAFEAANRIGDLTYAAYTRNNLNSDLLFAGEPLPEVQGEAEHGLAFAEKARFGLVIDIIATQLALIRMLRGLTLKFGCLDDGQFHELHIEHSFVRQPGLGDRCVLVLDPEIAGALYCRRLCDGHGRRIKGATAALDHIVAL